MKKNTIQRIYVASIRMQKRNAPFGYVFQETYKTLGAANEYVESKLRAKDVITGWVTKSFEVVS